jgi:predicted kinase
MVMYHTTFCTLSINCMELIIFIGLQASGKSTFYRSHFADTHDHISKDLLGNNKKPARRQHQLIEDALRAGHSVVVDNTNPTRAERAELIALGKTFGATIIGYFFEVEVKRSLQWNAAREGKARVPDIAIFATRKRLARPDYAEGYDQLFLVRALVDGQFAISVWQDDHPNEA